MPDSCYLGAPDSVVVGGIVQPFFMIELVMENCRHIPTAGKFSDYYSAISLNDISKWLLVFSK